MQAPLRHQATMRRVLLLVLLCLYSAWLHPTRANDITVSAGCNEAKGQDLEHVLVEDGGKTRYHIRSPRVCKTGCGYDPYSPVVCPSGYYEKDFLNGCQDCAGGCPACDGNTSTCILDKLFPNACRYLYSSAEDVFVNGAQVDLPSKRFYKIRQCRQCHPSCEECNGPLETDCTECPANGYYWPVNKRCQRIEWRFVHGAQYECLGADHCYLSHPIFKFKPMQHCNSYQVQLFPDQQFCLECNDYFCAPNCSYGKVAGQCAFRDFGNGFHCRSRRYKYLAVKARSCIDRYDVCSSDPCPEEYMCRSTLDWDGYACDCRNTSRGIICPQLSHPNPLIPTFYVNTSDASEIPSTASATTLQPSSSQPSHTMTLTVAPTQRRAISTAPVGLAATTETTFQQHNGTRSSAISVNKHHTALIAIAVGCGCLLLLLSLLVVVIIRRRKQQEKVEASRAVAKFLRRTNSTASQESEEPSVSFSEMTDDMAPIVS